jgi:hypothetical protein
MKIALTIDSTDNAAFGDTEQDARNECARIIRETGEAIDLGSNGGSLMDLHGNKVGRFDVSDNRL